MRRKKVTLKYIFAFLLSLPSLSFCQETKTYKGSFQIDKYKGEATYDYIPIGKDTLLDGVFDFQRSNLQSLIDKEDLSFSIKGHFTKNIPNKYWSFRFNEYKSNSKSTVEDYKYVVNVSGVQQTAFGNFRQGYPDGEWIFKIQQIKDSKVDTLLFKSAVTFDQGVPQGSFKIEGKKETFVGMFLRNGIAHDVWTLYSENQIDEIESWHFNEGVLQKIRLHINSTTKDIDIYKKVGGATKTIVLDKKYLDILKLKLGIENSNYIPQSGILRLLAENETHYKTVDTILSQLSGASFNPKFRVNVPYFPLKENEKTSMDSIVTYYNKSRTISNSLLNDSHLAIIKLSDKKIAFLEKSVDSISKNILTPLEQLIQYYEDDLFAFINRDELISKIWKQKEIEINSPYTGKNKNAIAILKNELSETYQHLDSIEKILSVKINKQKQQQEVITLEKRMIDQRNYLDTLIKSIQVDSITASIYVKKLQKLQKRNEEKLSRYAGIKSINKKVKSAKELVNCFENWNKTSEVLTKIPEQLYDIKQEYVDAMWNPFTATIMNETIKKRIITAYEDILIPYFLQKFDEENSDCQSNQPWIDLVNRTYNRMLEMRREDTNKMERKLKKDDDPDEVLQRFGIQIKANEK